MGLWIGMVEVWVCGSVWWRFDLAVCRLAVEYALGRSAAVGFCVLEVVVCGVCIDGGVYWWWGLGLLGFFFFFFLWLLGGCVWWWGGGWMLEVVVVCVSVVGTMGLLGGVCGGRVVGGC